ncbi:hypothetical protein L0Y40_00345 [Candidatus Wolfebacteria bacterium]|nr:hypothetical protein [Candidatus Wolfebacteria bacterium]
MKNIQNPEKHRKIYLGLSVLIFTLVGIAHLFRIFYGWVVVIGGITIPFTVSWLALFVTLMMVIMGAWYLRN